MESFGLILVSWGFLMCLHGHKKKKQAMFALYFLIFYCAPVWYPEG